MANPFVVLSDQQIIFDNTARLSRISSRRKFYLRLVLSSLFRLRITDLLRPHFSFLLPDFPRPAYITVEFTNYCNLRCPYCTSPLRLRPQGLMSAEMFAYLVLQIKQLRVGRVRIVGDGESTLHPRFGYMVAELARACEYLTVVTNGQWLNPDNTVSDMLRAPLRLIEVSVDSNCKEQYERARPGASFEKLVSNLTLLKNMRNKWNAPALINIRAMIRPSELATESSILRFWKPFGDTVISQYLHDEASKVTKHDLFQHAPSGRYPRCTLPLKGMGVQWDGNVPLCDFSAKQTDTPEGLLVGNISQDTLQNLWSHKIMKQYRQGHRDRCTAKIPICRGCVGQ